MRDDKKFRKRGHIPVERVLLSAKALALKDVLILGEDEDGTPYFASSRGDDRWLEKQCSRYLALSKAGELE